MNTEYQDKEVSRKLVSPEVKCWADPNLATAIELKGMLLGHSDDDLNNIQKKYKFLQRRVVSAGDRFWIKAPNSPIWVPRKNRGDAISLIREHWGEVQTSLNLSTNTFNTFFRDSHYFSLDQVVCVPRQSNQAKL